MSAPHEVLTQLLSAAQAESLDATGSSAWANAAQTLQTVLGAPPSIQEVDGRLVMPDEIVAAFADPHLAVPLELSTNQDQSAVAYLVVSTAVAATFLDSQADDPGDEEQQTIVIASTILGQVVQALNSQLFSASPSGLVVSLDDMVANAMPAILGAMDEPAMFLTATLQTARPLPFSLILPGTFLDIVAGAMPAPAAQAANPAASALLDSLPFSLTEEEIASAELLDEAPEPELTPTARPFATVPPDPEPLEEEAEPVYQEPPPLREPTPIAQSGPAAHRARFAPFVAVPPSGTRSAIDLLAGLQLNVTVELGRTELTVSEVLGLGPGSVIELDRLAGEPVDILVNDRLIARGEVVVVDENFGVRVVEVVRRGVEQEERTG
ncbi:MAG: flagellar motor switch protein FliN [Anaerolinea sp.]|nr:flagellar motor switch protein FliN [Anaerolinea sp.]